MDTDQIKGKLQNVFGKAEEAVGKAINNQNLVNAGTEDRVKGAATETWGDTKDAAHSVSDTVRTDASVHEQHAVNSGTSLGDRFAASTENLRDSIHAKLDNTREREAERQDSLDRSL